MQDHYSANTDFPPMISDVNEYLTSHMSEGNVETVLHHGFVPCLKCVVEIVQIPVRIHHGARFQTDVTPGTYMCVWREQE